MKNVCNCPDPPGGVVSCGLNQLAVCGYRDGRIVSGCFDKPDHAIRITDESEKQFVLSNWILSAITGVARSDYQAIEPDLIEMLSTGEYRNEKTGEVIKFSLPRDYNLDMAAKVQPATRSR